MEKTSWLVKGYPYSINIKDPTPADNKFLPSHIWVNAKGIRAYILDSVVGGVATWSPRPPDYIKNEGTEYQINVVERVPTGTGTTGAPQTITGLPNQSGHAGKFLTTDGDRALWAEVTGGDGHTQGTDQTLDAGGENEVSATQAKAAYDHSVASHAPADAVSLSTVKEDSDISSAVSLKHAQGADQGLDTGGPNAVTASEVKGAVTNSHAPGSDNQDLSGLVEKVTGSSLVPDTEIAKIHEPGSDNQDLSGLVEKVTGYSLVADTEIAKIHALHADDQDLSGLLDETAHDALDHTGLTGIPSISGLLDETAHDLLDHTGLTGVIAIGTGSTQAAAGNHNHSGVYDPAGTGHAEASAHISSHEGSYAHADIATNSAARHAQGTDQGLDTGGANAVTAAQAKAGYTHSTTAHAPSDAVALATVKADADIASAISLKHSAVTLAAGATSNILSLSTQELSVKTQNANLVLAGPASGAAAAPTFRSLVANDIPSLSGLYLPLSGGTMTGNIVMPDGGTIGQAAGPLLTFDDTGNTLQISGAKVGIGKVPTEIFHIYSALSSAPVLLLDGNQPTLKLNVERSSGGAVAKLMTGYAYNTTSGLTAQMCTIGALLSMGTSPDPPTLTYVYFSVNNGGYDDNALRLYPNKSAVFYGLVGINTTSPAAQLSINGGCHVGGDSDPGDNNLLVDGTGTITGAFGCNSKTAQTAYASGGALAAYGTGSYGLDSAANMSALHALVVKIRAALVANGIMS